MRTAVAIRWSLGVAVTLTALVGAVAMLAGHRPQPPQGAAIVGAAQISVRFVAPFVAAVTAYLLHPLSSYLDQRPPVRSRVLALSAAGWPILACGLVAYLVSCLWTAAVAGAPAAVLSGQALAMMGVDALVITTWFVLGAVAATVLPRLVAPLVGLVAYLWLAWLPALGTPWLRHVTGQQAGCCGPGSEPVPILLALGAATAIGLILAGGMVLARRDRRRRRWAVSAPALVVVVALVTASNLPQHGLFVMAQPRQDQPVCSVGQSTVCVWPEYAAVATDLRTTIEAASTRLADSGLGWSLPKVLSERPEPGEGLLGYNGQQQDQIIVNAAFEALVAREPDVNICWSEGTHDVDAVSVARMLIAVHAGASMDGVTVDESTRAETERLLAQGLDRQKAWLDGVVADCGRR